MDGKAVVVTGGTGALGSAVVEDLLAEGWTVHVPWTTQGSAEALAGGLGHLPGLHLAPRPVDLTAPDAVEGYVEAVGRASGGLDALCNLVGGFAMGSLEATDPQVWDRMMDTNAKVPFLCVRAALPMLRASRRGAVVRVAAAAAASPRGGMSAYLASKAAVVSLTRNLAEELADDGITVNAVAPTIIDTPAKRRTMPDADRSTWLSTREIAGVVRFLVGPEARTVSGNVLTLAKGPRG